MTCLPLRLMLSIGLILGWLAIGAHLQAATAQGLLGVYFNKTDLTGLVAVHKGEALNFTWNGAAPDAAVPGTNFSARWRGQLVPTVSGAYAISITADDGVRMWLGGQLVVDKWIGQSATEYTAPVSLVAGTPLPIVIEYYQGTGGSTLKLAWTGPGITKQIIPLASLALPDDTVLPTAVSGFSTTSTSDRAVGLTWAAATDNLQIGRYSVVRNGVVIGTTFSTTYVDKTVVAQTAYTYQVQPSDAMGNSGPISTNLSVTTPVAPPVGNGTGLSATFFSDTQLTTQVSTRTDAKVDVIWGDASPATGVSATTFSARWSGQLLPRYTESHKFTLVVCTNARLFVNNQLIIDAWNWGDSKGAYPMPRTLTGTISLTAGTPVPIRLDYAKQYGSARAHLYWESNSITKQIVPTQQLFPAPASDPTQNTINNNLIANPVWVEGTAGSDASTVSVTINGQAVPVVLTGAGRWFADSASSGGKPFGIMLAAGQTVNAVVTTTAAGGAQAQKTIPLSWTKSDLTGKTASTVFTIRTGDSLLLSATKVGGGGTTLAIDPAYNGTTFNGTVTGTSGQGLAVTFTTAGVRQVAASVDGAVVGIATVRVVGATLNGPIACQVSYQRNKDVSTSPGLASSVSFVSNDPVRFQVSVASTSTNGASLKLRPLLGGKPLNLQARAGSPTGPLIAYQKLDVFRLGDSSFQGVQFVQEYPDGAILTQAKLSLWPHVPDLSVKITTIVSGVTFEDSSTVHNTTSNAFSLVSGTPNSEYIYKLVLAPGSTSKMCHNTHAYQNGVQVSY